MRKVIVALMLLGVAEAGAAEMPAGFVWLKDVDPTIEQEIRYYGDHNFLGRPVAGYEAPECILTKQAAEALRAVQRELEGSRLSLKVYDCYRPQRAVDDFVAWSKDVADQTMKAEFYPRVDKARVFELGYIAEKSGHTRGSTVDLTIVPAGPRRSSAPLFPASRLSIARFRRASASLIRASTSAPASTAWTRNRIRAEPTFRRPLRQTGRCSRTSWCATVSCPIPRSGGTTR